MNHDTTQILLSELLQEEALLAKAHIELEQKESELCNTYQKIDVIKKLLKILKSERDHISQDTTKCICGHHHCGKCKTCHRCGCTNFRRVKKK